MQAEFIWSPSSHYGRQLFVLFRRDFFLQERINDATIHLFADTRYRLSVNGRFVQAGPPRFVTQFPEYDTINLARFLRKGLNCITVEVNFYGASSFQTMPDGRPGFVCWGKIADTENTIDFSTPGEWKCRVLDAWDSRSPLYSFAQNAIEICDTRRLEPSWFLPDKKMKKSGNPANESEWETPVRISHEQRPWGELKPSTAPVPDYRPAIPRTILCTASLADDEERWGFSVPEMYLGSPKVAPQKHYVGFATWIHSMASQSVEIGLHWGIFELNGKPLETFTHPTLGNRSKAELNLQKGWNLLTGKVEFLTSCEFWSFLIALPKKKNLILRAKPDLNETTALAISPLQPLEKIDFSWCHSSIINLPPDWQIIKASPKDVCPARLCAWDQPGKDIKRNLPYRELKHFSDVSAESGRFWVFQFKENFLGYVVIDLEGTAGTIVDIGFDDWLRDDGMIHLYRTNPFVNTVERMILRGGRQKLQLFNSRGGRYLQVLIRPGPVDGARKTACRLHGVRVLETKTIKKLGEFRCSDQVLTRVWNAACRTLTVSSEDSYSDSPWRERGTYIGDCYVNIQIHRLINHDLKLARRVLRLFAQTATPDGQLFCVAPSCLAKPHEDFTLIWALMLYEYWAVTGDLKLVEELFPILKLILESPGMERHKSGLWNADERRLFIDWGIIREERQGQANACLNAFRISALDHSAVLAEKIGKTKEAANWRSESAALRQSFSELLWLSDEERFAPSLPNSGEVPTSAFHANILAYKFCIGSTKQLASVERYVVKLAKTNYQRGISKEWGSGHAELYFMAYLLSALAEHGHFELAENLIREHLGPVVDSGLETLPECFARWQSGTGSACHSWSGYPAVYATRYILGLRQIEPGNQNQFILEPNASSNISRAEGIYPHPEGLIRVAWKRRNSKYEFSISAPQGVSVIPVNLIKDIEKSKNDEQQKNY